ncbi:hypothetical protein ACFQ51_52100 [Streptomyces kaempferi]
MLWSGCWMRPSTPKRSGCKPRGPARQAQPQPSRPPTPGRPETPAVGRRRAPRAPPPPCARTTKSWKASCTRCSAGSPVPPAGWLGGRAPSAALRHQLGQQLDALHAPDLAHRIDELTRHNHQLADQLQHATDDNAALRHHTASLEEDLAAARTSLRRMIRDENLNQ